MVCPERDRLFDAYRRAVQAYGSAVRELAGQSAADFPEQYAVADDLRQRCDRLRDAVAEHRREHGC